MFSSAPSQLLTLARKVAASQSLDPALVCAVMKQESGWNPWAMRCEPAFFSKYVAGLYTNNKISASEAYARGFSWGLMQPDGAIIPQADLKPLNDFTLDCQACQAKLSAAQGDLVEEKAKTSALTKERDDAVRLAKGGSNWRRVTRAAKWFLLGAAASAVVAKAH
jgi:hypothetical protein